MTENNDMLMKKVKADKAFQEHQVALKKKRITVPYYPEVS